MARVYDPLYSIYENILTFATEWRKYNVISKKLSQEEFRRSIAMETYIMIEMKKPDGTQISTHLVAEGSKIIAHGVEFKKLINKIKDQTEVILVTHEPLKRNILKNISLYKKIKFHRYLHQHFIIIIPKGPLCYQHRILSHDEIKDLLNNQLMCYLTNLPKICIDDPQCIWIGAKIGDVIEVKSYSDLTGTNISYRVVIARNIKFIIGRSGDEQNPIQVDEDGDVDVVDETEVDAESIMTN
jgi:DNA-directed RNA polymerase subunit H (RpoH/RPB5)